MRVRPNPLHLAISALAIGLAVFLVGVGAAWRSSGDRSLSGWEDLQEPLPATSALEPDVEPPPADGLAASLPVAETPATNPDAAETPPASTAPEPTPSASPAAVTAVAGSPARSPGTAPFYGMGTWVDVFDWAPSYAKGNPVKLGPSAVDAMAAQGVQVLYLQTTRADYAGPGDIVDPPVLQQWLKRAEAQGLQVVAWYLPTLIDVAADLRRLQATAALRTVDAIGVDIESRAVADPADRSRRLVELSRLARAALAGRPLSAITLPNVVTDVLNLGYWPGFPWAEIKPFYDVWQPMGYWTNRKSDSPYRDAERYTRENIERMRAKLGDPNAVVHPIGGVGDKTTAADVAGFLKAVRETRSVGASLYDWSTQSATSYAPIKAARA